MINNNIEEPHCSFEVSELLKKKGFDCECSYITNKKTKELEPISFKEFAKEMMQVVSNSWIEENISAEEEEGNFITVPTHSLAIKWIRENFNISITLYPHKRKWCCILEDISEKGWVRENGSERMMPRDIGSSNLDEYNSPEEATEAALLYTLQNLIK